MTEQLFVIDANILNSAIVFKSLKPALAIRKALTDGTLLLSPSVVEEYAATLSDSKFDSWLSVEKRLLILEKIVATGSIVSVTEKVIACRDSKDDKYLGLAVTGGASCIITGDKDLLVLHPFRMIHIITAAEFLLRF